MLNKHNILVVDDDSETREILRVLLESEDYAVVEAADGNAAVKMLAEESGGRFNVVRTPDSFEAKVYLPIKKA